MLASGLVPAMEMLPVEPTREVPLIVFNCNINVSPLEPCRALIPVEVSSTADTGAPRTSTSELRPFIFCVSVLSFFRKTVSTFMSRSLADVSANGIVVVIAVVPFLLVVSVLAANVCEVVKLFDPLLVAATPRNNMSVVRPLIFNRKVESLSA